MKGDTFWRFNNNDVVISIDSTTLLDTRNEME